MHCALQEISTDSLEISKAENDSLSKKTQARHIFTTPLKDCEDFSVSRNSESRPAILAFLTLDPDGNWRIVALPVQCLNHINFASVGSMGSLQLPCPPGLNGPKVDQHKARRRPLHDFAYSFKSFTGRSNTRSNVRLRCQNKIANRAAKLNELTGNSGSQSSLICSDSSSLRPDSSASVHSSDMLVSRSKADKCVKKKSKRKGRKKGKQSKKQSCDGGLTEPEVLPQEYVHVNLSSEICCSNDVDNLNGLLSYTAGPESSFSDDRLRNNKSERSEMGHSINLTEEPKNCTSINNEMGTSEAISLTVPKPSGEPALRDSKNQPQNRGPKPIVVDGEMEDTQHVQILHYDDMSSKDFSNIQDSLAFDSVGSKSDESTNAGSCVEQSNKASCRVSLSEPPGFDVGQGYILGHNLLNGGGNTSDQNEDTEHGAQNHGSSDKRVKQKRAVPGTSSLKKSGGLGNLHGRLGKENNHSVWQKVQKNDSDESKGDLKKVNSTFSQSNSNSKKVPYVNRNCNFAGDNYLLKTEDKKHLKNEVGRKSRGKIDPALKNDYSSYSWKGSHLNRSISNDNTKISIQQNEMSHIPSEGNSQQEWSGVSGSHFCINSPMVGFETNRVEQMTLESVHCAEDCLEVSAHLRDALHTISTMDTKNIEDQDSSLPMLCDNINQSSISEEQPPMHFLLLDDKVSQTEKKVSSKDNSEQNQSSGSTLWRWIPVGEKNAGLAVSESDISSLEYSDVPSNKDFTLEPNDVSSLNANSTCNSQTDHYFSCPERDECEKLGTQVGCMLMEQRDKHVAPHHLVYGCKDLDALENNSCKTAGPVNDASRVKLACEAVHMVTGGGGPIADFERLLRCCSPVICQSTNPPSCLTLTCLHGLFGDVPLSGRETPDLSLGSLWQWYEKHGSYGLEIRAQERLGLGTIPFRAYFVPSLSAIQLFKNCNNQCVHISKKFSNCKASQQSEISDMSENSSTAGQHPIFSTCFPWPCSQDACFPTPANGMSCSEVTSAKDNSSVKSTSFSDLELLFEYFESEQPQQRQPLYEKMEDLVKGDIQTKSKVYGDPTKLNSINLRDLHPRSWYSVAWYPIYRIPDGNFRTAFLTYHSLGHLVCRSIKTDSSTVNSCVVAPVVGLQSYNAQSECWFQLGHSVQTAEMSNLNPSKLLEERLQTLEETASLMARAVVNKGNLICTNRHPDYEFFISRRRY